MATNYYLTIKNFPHHGMKKKFDIDSFSFPLGNPAEVAPESGTPKIFSVTIEADKYTPRFLEATLNGQHYQTATLTVEVLSLSGTKQKIAFFDFFDVIVTRAVPSAGQGEPAQYTLIDFQAEKASYFEASVESVSFS